MDTGDVIYVIHYIKVKTHYAPEKKNFPFFRKKIITLYGPFRIENQRGAQCGALHTLRCTYDEKHA
jgi:hypothetical protein